MIRSHVYEYMDKNNIEHPFTSTTAYEKWFRLLTTRWPQLRFNRFVAHNHFIKLKGVMEEMNLFDKPNLIFTLHEKGCRLTLYHQHRDIAQKGQKRTHLVSPEHAENVTFVACVNAAGFAIPPMIICKGKKRKEQFSDDLPPLSCFEISEKGSMTHEVFVKWLNHFAKHKPAGKVLLIFDGAMCHLSVEVIEEADKHGVTLYCLPWNTTHELQPLDNSVFRSFEHYWDEEVLKFWRTRPERALTKDVFGKIFTHVWFKSMTMTNIQSGFRACGIWPFNENAIPDWAFAPSQMTKTAESRQSVPTPSISMGSPPSVPRPSTSEGSPPSFHRPSASVQSPLSILRPSTSGMSPLSIPKPSTSVRSILSVPRSFISMWSPPSMPWPFMYVESSPSIPEPSTDARTTPSISRPSIYMESSTSIPEPSTDAVSSTSVTGPSTSANLSENVINNVSFHDILETPMKTKSNKVQRKQDINYRTNVIAKSSFTQNDNNSRQKKGKGKGSRNGKGKGKQSKRSTGDIGDSDWFCPVCVENVMRDMRRCECCSVWFHEECVGLTEEDASFMCPLCDN